MEFEIDNESLVLVKRIEHEETRRNLWIDIIKISSSHSIGKTAALYADDVLKQFDQRFPNPVNGDK